ncbi:MAG: WhiB family transcriptional regulator [Actinobacteria bacterium]|nr:MAG: WhiB family transcriptional regulator [Actinomycetota bacterium]
MLASDQLLHEPTAGWRTSAACAGSDSDVFFPAPEDADGIAAAKEICASCPVREACLEYALSTNQGDGVWGGLDAQERRRLRRRIRDRERRKLAS